MNIGIEAVNVGIPLVESVSVSGFASNLKKPFHERIETLCDPFLPVLDISSLKTHHIVFYERVRLLLIRILRQIPPVEFQHLHAIDLSR